MNKPAVPVVIVSAMSRKNRAIGYKNRLLWHIPADLKRFKELTLGHPIIMGRKTFESIVAMLGKPLPGRTNIVVTRNSAFKYPGAIATTSLEEAFEVAERENPTEIHIGGGAELYTQALPYADKLYLTLVDSDTYADTFFPEFREDFDVVKDYPFEQSGNIEFQWVDMERRKGR